MELGYMYSNSLGGHVGSNTKPPSFEELQKFLKRRLLTLEVTHRSRVEVNPSKSNAIKSLVHITFRRSVARCVTKITFWWCARRLKGRAMWTKSNSCPFVFKLPRKTQGEWVREQTFVYSVWGMASHYVARRVTFSRKISTYGPAKTSGIPACHDSHRSVYSWGTASCSALRMWTLQIGPGKCIPLARSLIRNPRRPSFPRHWHRSWDCRDSVHLSLCMELGDNRQRSRADKFRCWFHVSQTLKATAIVLPHLTIHAGIASTALREWSHLRGLELADPDFCASDSIDLLLGADAHAAIIGSGIRKGGTHESIT